MSTLALPHVEQFLSRLRQVRKTANGWEACCPAHEDGNPSLSISIGDDGRLLLKCQAGCPTKAVVSAIGLELRDLFLSDVPASSKPTGETCPSGEIVATYPYCDEDRVLLFEVVRFPGKRFRQRRLDGTGGWVWNLKGVRRVLYRLPELLQSRDKPVWIVEGEKDADNLVARGLVATTNPGGAGKWRREYSQFLKDRDVIILPDNDAAGRKHAEKVAESLGGTARSVKVMGLPDLREKGDVSDWLAGGHTVEELQDIAAKGQPCRLPAPYGSPAGSAQASAGQPQGTQAGRLANLAIEQCLELFHDERGHPYAVVPATKGTRIVSLGSSEFRDWLSGLAWRQIGLAASEEILKAARSVLSSRARFDGLQHTLHTRCAWHDGAIWLDMDGCRAVRIGPARWQVVDEPPVLFRSFAHQEPIPEPSRGGDLREVLRFVNLRSGDEKHLFLCYLVAALVPNAPIAALVVHGVQGAAKTTLLRVVKKLLDPSRIEVRGGVKNLEDFAHAAWQNRVLFFDNITNVPDWLSDAFCRAVTGDGWSKRTLYTDEDSTVFEYRGVLGLAGVHLVADRPDLLDRSLILPLEPLSPEHRRDERTFWDEFREVRPRILGGLLDALARAMSAEPRLRLHSLPRMADFARWGAAASQALGARPEDFLRAYAANVGRQNEAAVEASPVAQAVLELMKGRVEWGGTPAELLKALEGVAADHRLDTKCAAWPKAPSWAVRRLKEVFPNLLALDIGVEDSRRAKQRLIRLIRATGNAVIGVTGMTEADVGVRGPLAHDTTRTDGVTNGVTDGMAEGAAAIVRDCNDGNDGISGQPWRGASLGQAFPWCEEYWERVAIMVEDGALPENEARGRAAALVFGEFGASPAHPLPTS